MCCEAESMLDMPGYRGNGQLGQGKMMGGGDNEGYEWPSERAAKTQCVPGPCQCRAYI